MRSSSYYNIHQHRKSNMDYSFYNPVQHQPYRLFEIEPSLTNTPSNALIDNSLPTFEYNNNNNDNDYPAAFSAFLPPNSTALGPHAAPPPPPLPSSAQQHQQHSAPRSNSISHSHSHSHSHSNMNINPHMDSLHQSIDMVRDDLAQYMFSEFVEEPLADKRGSSEEEKDGATPAQTRRKAQNRAAQRAFRERKERHVRELEKKLTDLQAQSMTLHADNERLKRELAKIVTENEILRATGYSGMTGGDSNSHQSSPSRDHEVLGDRHDDNANPTTTAAPPPKFKPKALDDVFTKNGNGLPHRALSSETGERLLNTRAAWDFIQAHPLYKQGLVDIGDIYERLKTVAKCDGQGPVFEEGRVRKAIEESVASGNDELI